MFHYIFQSFSAEFKALMASVTFQFADDAGGDSQLHNISTEYWWVFPELIVSSADKLYMVQRQFQICLLMRISPQINLSFSNFVCDGTIFKAPRTTFALGKNWLHNSCWTEPTKSLKMCFFLSVICCKAIIISMKRWLLKVNCFFFFFQKKNFHHLMLGWNVLLK